MSTQDKKLTTPEEARAREVEACDNILSAPWLVQKMIGAEGRQLARANRNYWQQATTEELQRLANLIDQEPKRSEEPGPITHEDCGWKKGPLPPNTFNWGGVIPVGDDIKFGFFFADFKGNHVILVDGQNTRLEAHQVGWYNNCLELPSNEAKRLS